MYDTFMGKSLKYKLTPLAISKETIGERIAFLRKQKGYTQKDLADKIGITRHVVSDYETGRIHLNDEMVIRFALVLGTSADTLLGLQKMNVSDVKPSIRIIRRLQKIETLPPSKQKALFTTIDNFLKAEGMK
jgi:transcriptional regulator with XRE-family HTH domain